jgi:hypothetical protein
VRIAAAERATAVLSPRDGSCCVSLPAISISHTITSRGSLRRGIGHLEHIRYAEVVAGWCSANGIGRIRPRRAVKPARFADGFARVAVRLVVLVGTK